MRKGRFPLYLLAAVLTVYAGVLIAPAFGKGSTLITITKDLGKVMASPFSLKVVPHTPVTVGILLAIMTGAWLYAVWSKKTTRYGEEYGSARWERVDRLKKKYASKQPDANILLSQGMAVSTGSSNRKCRNLNALVAGGPGTGKTQGYVLPNLMQMGTSYIVTDPKGEILRSAGRMLMDAGYDVKVFDLVNPAKSHRFNPFAYIRDDHLDEDTMRFVEAVIRNTTDKKAHKGDDFWEKAEVLLLLALVRYIKTQAPEYEQNFETLMQLVRACEVREDEDDFVNAVDMLFQRLEVSDPDNRAIDSYKSYKMAAGKTAKSILISSLARLAKMDTSVSREVTAHDELDLYSLGDKKTALFLVISDSDGSMNFLAGLLYTFAFQSLFHQADNVHHGGLPIPVHCIMDEFPNIALPDAFQRLLATMRSRNIACSMIVQTIAQLKELYKDNWHVLTGNCALQLFLGGTDPTTTEYFSKLLGKQTIDTKTHSVSKGSKGSYSTNYQRTGRDLMTPDEVGRLPMDMSLVLLMGEQPVKDKKFDPGTHRRIHKTVRGGAKPYLRADRMTRRRLADFSIEVFIPESYKATDERNAL